MTKPDRAAAHPARTSRAPCTGPAAATVALGRLAQRGSLRDLLRRSLVRLALRLSPHWPQLAGGKLPYIDAFNVYLVVLTAFVGLTTSIFSRPYMRHEVRIGRLTERRMRLYHAMYQAFMFAMLLALSTNNLGVLWVAMEGATLATVLLVSLYRTPESVEAAWKYFILCGVGIAQALFGTVLVYFAAEQCRPRSHDAV